MADIIPFPSPRPRPEGEIVVLTMDELFATAFRGKTLTEIGCERIHEASLNLLRSYDVPTLRRFWDNVSDIDSFYDGLEGSFDCADIHRVLNEKGDGYYCAV